MTKPPFVLVPKEDIPWTEEQGLEEHTRPTGRTARTGSTRPLAGADRDRATRKEKWAQRG